MDPDLDGWEDEDFSDVEDDFFTVPCPNCGAEIHEDTPRCPVCGEYITAGSGRFWEGKPVWYVCLALLGIAAVIVGMVAVF